jgi:hypothetical protein
MSPRLLAYLAMPALLLALSPAALDDAPSICLWRWLAGHDCPGCGITRALVCTSHMQWRQALAFNPMVMIVAPGLALAWAHCVWRELRAPGSAVTPLG